MKLRAGFFFILANLAVIPALNTNSNSRLAAAFAFCSKGSFAIDDYVLKTPGWTTDWSHAPDSHYYSNKAPGPILLSLPVVCAVDWVSRGLATHSDEEDFSRQFKLRYLVNFLLVLLFQLLPFLWVVSQILKHLRDSEVSASTLVFARGALYWGSTAVLFMNTWFGHGLAAIGLCASAVFVLEESFFLAGFATAMAILCEYTVGLYLPAFLIVLFLRVPIKDGMLRTIKFVAGAFGPAMLGALYQWLCFGRPWYLPQKFQNPDYVDVHQTVLWGIFGLPKGSVFLELLLGPSRGLMWTQPWVLLIPVMLVVFAHAILRDKKLFKLVLISTVGFLGLLLMNASFGAWHAGGSSGPRYLSPGLPLLAWPAALLLGKLPHKGVLVKMVWASWFVALLFTTVALSSTIYEPPGAFLWAKLCSYAWQNPATFFLRFGMLALLIPLSLELNF